MKRIVYELLVLILFVSLTACGNETNNDKEASAGPVTAAEPTASQIPEEPSVSEDDLIEDEEWEKLNSLGKVQTENGIFYVYLTVPADLLTEEVTQESIDANAGDTYTSGVLNEDGSVTYKMTKKQHKAMITSLTEGLDKALQEMVDSPDNSITEIRHNKSFTEFDAVLSTNEVGLADGFMVIGFYMYGGIYSIFSGESADNISVNFYAPDGTLITTANSKDMKN